MKKMILSLLAVLCCGTISANNHPAPGKFGLTAEYLYLKPSIDDTYFVVDSAESNPPIDGTPVLIGKRENNDFIFHSGYRVAGVYSFCKCDRSVEFSYTHFNQNQHKSIAGDFLNGLLGGGNFLLGFEDTNPIPFADYTGTASSHLGVDYNRGDGLFSQGVFDCCDSKIYLLLGFEYYYLHVNEHYRYNNTTSGTVGFNKQSSHVWGAGPELGVEIDYAFWDCQSCLPGTLSLIVKSTASLLASEITANVYSAITESDVTTIFSNFNDKKTWKTIPAFHARVGLGYEMCICRYEASLEVGYEFNSYFRGFVRNTTPDELATTVVTEYNNYDLQGLYVSASVSF